MRNSKRLYIGLLFASLVVIGLIFLIVYNLIRFQNQPLFKGITIGLAIIFIILFILVAAGSVAILLSIIRAQKIPSLEGSIRIATTLLFPVAVQLGKIVGIAKERTLGSFIEVNNYLVKTYRKIVPAGRVMILAPHCLQDSDCPFKITTDIKNCRRCGKCAISGLIEVAEQHGAILRIATGGTLARQIIEDANPKGVVAIACERDLSLGIKDATPLPVIGVLNQRPNGPCHNTQVDMIKVEEALGIMLHGG
ncbi:MAG: DUF116 domain-containing protein [Syntrophomonadaceae bacterium]|nr:DUF116 domain-containing protein [Syntrophomonadaceae bacterium]